MGSTIGTTANEVDGVILKEKKEWQARLEIIVGDGAYVMAVYLKEKQKKEV